MSKRAKRGGAAKAVPLPLSDFAEARGRWRSEVQAGLGDQPNPKNRSGVEVKALYTPEDWPGGAGEARYMEALGFPGQPPMTRGIYATMHRGRTWTQRQLIGLGVPEDYNRRLKTILAHGGSAVSLIPCNSVYRGYDADEVPPEVLGTCGATVNSVEDMAVCLDGIPIGDISTSLNDPSPFTLLALELAVAKNRGIPWERISGTSNQSDYLSHFVANHMFFRLALPGARRVLLDHIAFARRHLPQWNPLSVVGQHMQQAGATPAEAMGLTLSSAIQYAGDCLARGWDPDQFLPRFTFFFDISMSFFEEVAKFRAGRRIWAELARERLRRQGPALLALQVPRADLGRGPDARAAAQQHPARDRAGDGRHLRRAAVAAHGCLRRGAVGADREGGAHRHRHAEHPQGRGAPDRRDRSAGRLLLRRGADRRDGGQDPRGDRAHRCRRRHVCGGGSGPAAADLRRLGAGLRSENRREAPRPSSASTSTGCRRRRRRSARP